METITRDTDRDFFMSPQEAIEVRGRPATGDCGAAGLAPRRLLLPPGPFIDPLIRTNSKTTV
jgi:hypothetical protein